MVSAKAPVPTWLLAIGGFGIAFGLATCKFLYGLRPHIHMQHVYAVCVLTSHWCPMLGSDSEHP
jgi:hypothetical protein